MLCAGVIVFLLLLWATVGHKVASRSVLPSCVLLVSAICSLLDATLYREPAACQPQARDSGPWLISFVPASSCQPRRSPCCRQNYFGEGSMACIMGLMMGTILLASQELLGKATLHSMLTFNPGNFFT